MKNCENEVRYRWGNTDAYREYEQKTKNYEEEKWRDAKDGLMAIFAKFAVYKNSGVTADSAEVQVLVAKLQAHITENYYTCTDDILAGLGKMYACDEGFKNNINKYEEGTAEFAAKAIEVYLNNKESIRTCEECGSEYLASKSAMMSLCPECAHVIYGYENCNHLFRNGKCTFCFWDGSQSDYIKKLLRK